MKHFLNKYIVSLLIIFIPITSYANVNIGDEMEFELVCENKESVNSMINATLMHNRFADGDVVLQQQLLLKKCGLLTVPQAGNIAEISMVTDFFYSEELKETVQLYSVRIGQIWTFVIYTKE